MQGNPCCHTVEIHIRTEVQNGIGYGKKIYGKVQIVRS